MSADDLATWLLRQVEADEEMARLCAEMFPPPWEIADRGWRVRIYAADVSIEDLSSDEPDAMTVRNPVVMEVEPDRHIQDPRWLSERVDHVRRHDPAHVLAQCAAVRAVVALHQDEPQFAYDYEAGANEDAPWAHICSSCGGGGIHEYPIDWPCPTLRALALPYADQPGWREEWRP